MAKKFRTGRPCVIDPGTDQAEEGVLLKQPFKNQFGEWFVVVAVICEDMGTDGEYHPKRFDIRILKERVRMK